MKSADFLKRDPRFVRVAVAWLRPILRAVFRFEVTGLENVRSGAQLLIANHNSGAVFETLALLAGWVSRFGPDRAAYGLAHSIGFRIPLARSFLRAIGAVPATEEIAHEVLRAGAALLIFPGGNWQTVRPIWRDGDRDFGGRRGWTRIALSSGVPVVPVRIDGSHFINPYFARSRGLSMALVLPWLLGVRWFPISLAQLLATALVGWLGWGIFPVPIWIALLYLAFLVTPLWPVFPAKIRIHFGAPIVMGEGMNGDRLYQLTVAALAQPRS